MPVPSAGTSCEPVAPVDLDALRVALGPDFSAALDRNEDDHEADCELSCQSFYCGAGEAAFDASTVRSHSLGPLAPEDFASDFKFPLDLIKVSSEPIIPPEEAEAVVAMAAADGGPTLYASGPSIPQYQPEPSSGPYGGVFNDGLPEGASPSERVMAVAGMAWDGMMRLGSKAARTGYRTVSQCGGDGGGNQDGLLGGGGGGVGAGVADTESGAPSYAPPGSGGTATMEGIGGGGNGAPEEGYSMVAYARQFVSDIAALVAAAPAPVQYALILLVCYLFWKIFA